MQKLKEFFKRHRVLVWILSIVAVMALLQFSIISHLYEQDYSQSYLQKKTIQLVPTGEYIQLNGKTYYTEDSRSHLYCLKENNSDCFRNR